MVGVAWPQPMLDVRLVRRLNRFAVEVLDPSGHPLVLHLPNSGRMAELLVPGAPGLAYLLPAGAASGDDPARPGTGRTPDNPPPARRTAGVLLAVRYQDRWVGVDARLPNPLFEAALRAGALPPFRGYNRWRREAAWEGGRIDFVLEGTAGTCLVETKSCNRVDDGVALFPDAPTARGARHLRSLAAAARTGHAAAVVWWIQRDDATCLRPFAEVDPEFAAAIAEAAAAGVGLYAYRCRVDRAGVHLDRPVPVVVAG